MNTYDRLDERDKNEIEETGAAPSLTRRQWFLRLGEAAVLAGFSGVADQPVAALASQPPAAETQASLPPGLYGPSPEHMAHALTSDQRFVTPPPGSETEYVTPIQGPFEPTFFSREDFQVVRQSVRLTLNSVSTTTTSVGIPVVGDQAIDEISQWIDLVVREAGPVREAARSLSAQHRTLAVHFYEEQEVQQLENEDEQKTWNEGLTWLKQQAGKLSAQGFPSLTEAQQAELLSSARDSSSDKHADSVATRFYRVLKRRTIEGYYTSQAGLKELDYQGNAFHAQSPGCPDR